MAGGSVRRGSAGAGGARSDDLATACSAVGVVYVVPQHLWPRGDYEMPTMGRVWDDDVVA